MQLLLSNPPKRRKRRKTKTKIKVRRQKRRAVRRAKPAQLKGGASMAKRTKTRRKPVTRSRRRRAGRRAVSRGGFSLNRGGFISRDLLMMAGGVVAGSLGTSFILGKLRENDSVAKYLPVPTNGDPDYKGAIVTAGIGLLGGYFGRKYNQKMATMFAVGGVVAAATGLIAQIQIKRQRDAAIAKLPQGQMAGMSAPYMLEDGSIVNGYEVNGYEPVGVGEVEYA
jgi:hypothetical protein